MSDPILRGYPVIVTETVRWGDMDAFQHVNNTVYFRYFESARIAYFERVGFRRGLHPDDIGPILAETACRFRRAVTYPDTLSIGVRVASLGEDALVMEHAISSAALADIVAVGSARVASYAYQLAAKAPLPGPVTQAIRKLQPEPIDTLPKRQA